MLAYDVPITVVYPDPLVSGCDLRESHWVDDGRDDFLSLATLERLLCEQPHHAERYYLLGTNLTYALLLPDRLAQLRSPPS